MGCDVWCSSQKKWILFAKPLKLTSLVFQNRNGTISKRISRVWCLVRKARKTSGISLGTFWMWSSEPPEPIHYQISMGPATGKRYQAQRMSPWPYRRLSQSRWHPHRENWERNGWSRLSLRFCSEEKHPLSWHRFNLLSQQPRATAAVLRTICEKGDRRHHGFIVSYEDSDCVESSTSVPDTGKTFCYRVRWVVYVTRDYGVHQQPWAHLGIPSEDQLMHSGRWRIGWSYHLHSIASDLSIHAGECRGGWETLQMVLWDYGSDEEGWCHQTGGITTAEEQQEVHLLSV